MSLSSNRRLTDLILALARKDLLYVRWYAGIVWAIALASLLAPWAARAGWNGPQSLAAYSLSPASFIAYLGMLASMTLDCPWGARAFSRGRPVAPGTLHLAKLGALIVAFGLPLLLLPGPGGRLILASGSAVAGYLTFFLLYLHATLPFERSIFAFLAHGVVFILMLNMVGIRAFPTPRFDHVGILFLWDIWLTAGLFLAASCRSRWVAVICSAVVIAVFAYGAFTLRRF